VALAEAGATAFRLNASHMSATAVARALGDLRAELPEAPVVIDLQGAKMRIGEVAARELRVGEVVRFAVSPSGPDEVFLPHAELFDQIEAGESLSVDDDRLRFVVASIEGGVLEARVLAGGTLRPRKGVNVVEHPVRLGDLGAADAEVVERLAGDVGVTWALSFVADGSELDWVRRRAEAARVIAKVERAAALGAMGFIARAADAIWICRGDLGAQVGAARLARWVGEYSPGHADTAVLMAGQVFEHLTRHAEPTRSEVCHLYDLIRRGYDGIVLSDETAIGVDPQAAVRCVAGLAREIISQGDLHDPT
jgi:pyruvate kinase